MNVKKFVITACAVLALGFVFSAMGLDAYYRANRPFEPRPDEGRLYVTELSKGVSVYLTHREQLIYQLLMPSGAGLIIVAIFLNLYWKQFPLRR
jgi:hypothetical protein